VLDAQAVTEAGDHRRFGRAFIAQPVIDRPSLDPSGQGRVGEQEQGQAVGAARNRDAEPSALRRPDPREIGAKAL